MPPASRLTRRDWALAALERLVAGGADSVSVEGVARDLGVTKGSFYWHYRDRAALLAGALELWEEDATADVITRLDAIADPLERLRALLGEALGDLRHGPLDVGLLARGDDPVIGPVVRRVTERRLAYLERIFEELGRAPADAALRARFAYSLYAGHVPLRGTLPRDPVLAAPLSAYVDEIVALLTRG